MPDGEPAAAPRLRTTASRLEREIRDGNGAALGALHAAHAALVAALLDAARAHGFLGDDPQAAIAALAAPDERVRALGAAAADLWLAFFSCVRPGEQPFADEQDRAVADDLNRRLAAVPAGERPDPALAADLLAALGELWQRRQGESDARLDRLLAGAAAPAGDALAEAIAAAATAAGVDPAGAPAEVLARTLARLRETADGERRRARETVGAFAAFLAAVRAVAARQTPPSLPGEAMAVIDGLRRLDADAQRLGAQVQTLQARVAELERERLALAEELAERERRLAALPAETATDQRLALYRQAFAELSGGKEHAATLERLRAIEQVVHLPAAVAARLVKVGDHHHAELVRAIAGLHAVAPLTDDPARLRPRGGLLRLGRSSGPDLKTPRGVVAALRDAGLDLRTYSERVRWALGVQRLAKRVPELRAVFRELVGLMAEWRRRLGDPPPVSQSLPLDGSGAVLALPAVVARDLEAVARRKSKAGKAAEALAPLLEACVGVYRTAVAEARGEPAAPSQPSKRESPLQAVARLAQELAALAASAESAFAEAARDGFRLEPADAALLGEDHLLRAGLQALAGACEELVNLDGAPDPAGGAFPPLPGRDQSEVLAAAVSARADWLEGFARWRIEVL